MSIYLDNSATTKIRSEALQKYIEGCGVSADVVDYRNDWLTSQYTLPDFFSVIKKRKLRSILNSS